MARAERRRKAPRPAKRSKAVDQAVRTRRLLLIGAVVFAAIVLFAWFPASSLLSQRSSLKSAEAQLSSLHAQDAALSQEQKNLSDSTEIGRIAREQYQLVSPNQQAYEVLPPSGSAASGTRYAGDPGSASPAAPSAASELPPGDVTTTTLPADRARSHPTQSARPASGFFDRMLHSLEFWR